MKTPDTPKEKADTIEIPPVRIQRISITLVGDAPLVCHRWSAKARKQMLDKQTKKAQQARAAKDPFQDYVESLYWISACPAQPTEQDIAKAKFGFPALAFKQAAVDACTQVSGIKKTFARGAFHVDGDLVPIFGKVRMREDSVRLSGPGGKADLRYRGEFPTWRCELTVRFNAAAITPEQVVNLFNVAGFAVGIGEHRAERDGNWGLFHVEVA